MHFHSCSKTESKALTGMCCVSCRLSEQTDEMQFSHCYCFASERKVASAKCLVSCADPQLAVQILRRGYMKQVQPLIVNSGFSTESVHWK